MNPFEYLETETIHKLNGKEVNAYVEKMTGHKIDPVRDGDVPGDDSEGFLVINVQRPTSAWLKTDLELFKESGDPGFSLSVIRALLSELATTNDIPSGTYHILYTWG